VKKLTSFFCRARHWQVFVLVWGAYVIGGVGVVNNPQRTPLYSEAAILLFVLLFAGWLWSIGSFPFSIAKPALRLNIRFFRFAIIFAGVYLPPTLGFHFTPTPFVALLMLALFLFAIFAGLTHTILYRRVW
jgi:hypothetical protein